MTAPTRPAPAYLLPVGPQWLWVSPLQGASALVNRAAAGLLRGAGDADAAARSVERVDELQALQAEPAPRPVTPAGPLVPQTLGLIPTRACNMACTYCDFGAAQAGKATMSDDLAASAIDWAAAARRAAGHDRLHVQFFGGEPLSAPDAVAHATAHTRRAAAAMGLGSFVDATTNGCFGQRECRLVGEQFDAVVVSIDGPAEVQDRHRPLQPGRGSSAVVERNLHQLSTMPAELSLRMCVSRQSVASTDRHARWLLQTFAPRTLAVEGLSDNPRSRAGGLSAPDPLSFARQLDRVFGIAADAGVRAVYAATETGRPRASACPVGRDDVIVSPDGRLSGCYLLRQDWRRQGLDLDLGAIEAGTVRLDPAAVQRLRDLAARRPRCRACFCRYTCAGGCHVNRAGETGHGSDYCRQTRLVTATQVLRNLGRDRECDALLADDAALSALADQRDDRVTAVEA